MTDKSRNQGSVCSKFSKMRKKSIYIFLVLGLFMMTAFQDSQIKVQVEAVNILATVVNKQGQLITDLTQDGFEIREDGVPQKITNFSRQSDLPLRIALLIDTSSSVRVKLDFEKQAIIKFVYSVMRPFDQALLAEFDSGISLVHDFTHRPSDIAKAIKNLRAGGGTALVDALYTVARERTNEGNVRQVIVVVSDGRDHDSRRTVEETMEVIGRSGATIYAVGTNRFSADNYRKGEELLRNLVGQTGGQAFFPYSIERLDDTFENINDELRTQYNLTYIPSNSRMDGQFRKVKVRFSHKDELIVRHRTGYFAPSQ